LSWIIFRLCLYALVLITPSCSKKSPVVALRSFPVKEVNVVTWH
jgi:hypothetical protein